MTGTIRIAGNRVTDPGAVITAYIDRHHGTVTNFDLLASDDRKVEMPLIKATRSPWMNSRISDAEADWFIERSQTAPWRSVPADAHLADADPVEVGGLYDAANALYSHFYDGSPKGIAHAKVSKVLHVMRPHLVPILDSRLASLYRPDARIAAEHVRAARPEFRHSSASWAAIRSDLVAALPVLEQIRSDLGSSPQALPHRVADKVSDLRLLDMITWKL